VDAFAAAGFPCPMYRNPTDHFMSVVRSPANADRLCSLHAAATASSSDKAGSKHQGHQQQLAWRGKRESDGSSSADADAEAAELRLELGLGLASPAAAAAPSRAQGGGEAPQRRGEEMRQPTDLAARAPSRTPWWYQVRAGAGVRFLERFCLCGGHGRRAREGRGDQCLDSTHANASSVAPAQNSSQSNCFSS
jgi:hypothetical protein